MQTPGHHEPTHQSKCETEGTTDQQVPLGLSPPTPLTAEHDISEFVCIDADLAEWLKRHALTASAKTYVVTPKDSNKVIAFYSLSAGAIKRHTAPTAALRRNMPDPLPVFVLGRLAVHKDWMDKGIGKGLLKDAFCHALEASKIVAARLLVCHALDETAKNFYLKHGFVEAPLDSALTVVASLK